MSISIKNVKCHDILKAIMIFTSPDRYRSCGSKTLRVMKLQKLEYVIFGRFQRPITPKFLGAGKNVPPYDTVQTPSFHMV